MRRTVSALLSIMIMTGGIIMLTGCEKEKTKEATLTVPVKNFSGEVVGRTDYEVTWDEDDLKSGGKFNQNAARLCAVMAASAAKGYDVQKNLYALGLSHLSKFSYESRYDGAKTGIAMGSVKEGEDALVAVILRETSGDEWQTNFEVGEGIEHEGFKRAALFALDRLNLYLFNYQIDTDHVRFLITGYSRGAAAANILAKNLTDIYGKETVISYTFATPNTTISDLAATYDNIFNFIKEDDLFTHLPPKGWGFRRYGTDIILDAFDPDSQAPRSAFEESAVSGATPDSVGDVRSVFRETTGTEYRGVNVEKLSEFLDEAERLAPDRKSFYEKTAVVGEEELSLHDLMLRVIDVLTQEKKHEATPDSAPAFAAFEADELTEDSAATLAPFDEAAMDFFTDVMISDYSGLMTFFLDGIDPAELLLTGEIPHSPIADSHSMVGYIAALDKYKE